jgi:hypothetical protein
MAESERFWAKVRKSSGCWEWVGARFDSGYGAFKRRVDGEWKQQRAHRVAYELAVRPIPNGMLVCHRCDNPPCCNPLHLFLGSGTDNQQDMIQKGRKAPHPSKLPDAERARRKADARRAWQAKNRARWSVYIREWRARNPELYRGQLDRRRAKRQAQSA